MQQTDERDTLATLLGMRHAMLDEYDHIQAHAKCNEMALAAVSAAETVADAMLDAWLAHNCLRCRAGPCSFTYIINKGRMPRRWRVNWFSNDQSEGFVLSGYIYEPGL